MTTSYAGFHEVEQTVLLFSTLTLFVGLCSL